MKTRNNNLLPLAALTLTLSVGAASAASVLWVDNETPDAGWSSLITTSTGHSYTLFDTGTHDIDLGDPASLAYAEGFDVAIISGSNAAFNALSGGGATWNTLSSTPLITMANFQNSGQFSSDNNWRWFSDGDAGVPNYGGTVAVPVPGDPVWNGVTISPTTDLWTSNVGQMDLAGKTLKLGITVLATRTSDTDVISVAHAAPGAILTGSQEQYFIAGMSGSAGPLFTADGEKVFLNAIDALTVPEPTTTALLGLGGLALILRRRK